MYRWEYSVVEIELGLNEPKWGDRQWIYLFIAVYLRIRRKFEFAPKINNKGNGRELASFSERYSIVKPCSVGHSVDAVNYFYICVFKHRSHRPFRAILHVLCNFLTKSKLKLRIKLSIYQYINITVIISGVIEMCFVNKTKISQKHANKSLCFPFSIKIATHKHFHYNQNVVHQKIKPNKTIQETPGSTEADGNAKAEPTTAEKSDESTKSSDTSEKPMNDGQCEKAGDVERPAADEPQNTPIAEQAETKSSAAS